MLSAEMAVVASDACQPGQVGALAAEAAPSVSAMLRWRPGRGR
ncbi:hypothetical protein [Streptomyces sp. NPDC088762]